jgi:hypothetical protein
MANRIHPATDETLQRIAAAVEIMAEPSRQRVYGFDLDMGNSDPAGCVTYAGENLNYTPAHMDYANDVFDYGDWDGAFFMPRPCMLSLAGTVERYLDPNDLTKFEDGTASDVATSTTANAMMEWPIIWVRRWQAGNVYHFRCAPFEFEGSSCLANVNASGAIVPFYTPIYFGSLDGSGRLRSLSGGANYVNTDTDEERAAAALCGSGWEIERMVDWLLINDLLVLMAKTRDSQTAFGHGVNGASAAIAQGTMNDKGLFYGKSDEVSGVKVFGMENFYGNIWRRLVGWVMVDGVQKIKLTVGTEDNSTGVGYNTTGAGYIELSGATPSGTSGGYVSANKVTDHGLIPVTASGSATTYSCDGLWFNNSGTRLACVGGSWSYGAKVGASFAHLDNTPAARSAYVGAAPSYK